MKFHRFAVGVAVLALTSAAWAQETKAPASEAQKTFTVLKSLAGNWEGRVVTDMPLPPKVADTPMHVSLRVTSRGNAMVHEMTSANSPDDPVTMFYVDGDRLYLTHYCDAGNRPRMAGTISPDGKTVDFELVDVSGSMKEHMHHAVFHLIDENHHTEEWTFMLGDKAIHGSFDLQRTK